MKEMNLAFITCMFRCHDHAHLPVWTVYRHFGPSTVRIQDISALSDWYRGVRTFRHQCWSAQETVRHWYRNVVRSLFTPGPFRSPERIGQWDPYQFAPWNFRSCPFATGQFVPWPLRFCNAYLTLYFRCLKLNYIHFGPWSLRSLVTSVFF